ncbi:glycosyltransferase family 2 protein [Nostoc sp.]|uniref:glycosyltransferase family 2 protein n=1 Tax=Nostoc sp. TaxID=1180 RepID=UPI002FFA3FDE
MSISFSALITNYNTWQLTTLCAQELERWSKENLTEILVVDDASVQNAPENLPDKVRIIHNPENRGYVASVNIGFSHVKEDVIILFDSDAYPLMDLTQSLAHLFATNSQLGAVGFKLIDEQGQPTGSYSTEPNVLGLLLGQQLAALYNSRFKHTRERPLCLHSCGMAVRRIAFEKVGGFDEGFDFLDADIDFSMRLRAAGWHMQIDPSLVAYHKGGGSFQTTAKRVLRHHRNRWRLLAKHGHLPLPWLLKAGLVTRHALEYSFLIIVGKVVIKDSATLKDKLYGRRQLLNEVWSSYGNEY